MSARLTMMGADGPRTERYVFIDGIEIGRVVPRTIRTHRADGRAQHANTWEAIDSDGDSHGNHWLTNWEAARALVRGLHAKLEKERTKP